MLVRTIKQIYHTSGSRTLTTSSKQKRIKVAVLGACGNIGQPLSMLLKQSPLISELCLYDVANAIGVACDLSHIETPVLVNGFNGPEPEKLKMALERSDIVIITANKSLKRPVHRDDLFSTNAVLVKSFAREISEMCPNALVGVISNPVNSLVPVVCKTLEKAGKFDPNRVFGITTLDVIRARIIYGNEIGADPQNVGVPVIGGHAGITILPLLSRASPSESLSIDQLKRLTEQIQEAGQEVYNAKGADGPATLSMAHAGEIFTLSLARALRGESNIIQCAYVQSDVTEAKYFATPLLLGENGIKKNLGLGNLSGFEQELLCKAIPELQRSIKLGEDFVISNL